VAGVTPEAYNDREPSFRRVTVDDKTLTAEYFLVPFEGALLADSVDAFTLNWKSHKLV
jgi:hypothetical protein